MSQESDHGETVTASAGGVTVEKTFAADEFPVPAVKFVIQSERDDVVDVRLSDDIPESFSMDRVGFHPDYESANWTAYEDQFVEYERTLDPSEEVLTVYGVRIEEDEDSSAFLTDPMLETIVPGDGGDSVESVVGDDSSRAVRNALADEATELPGLDADDPLAVDAVPVEPAESDAEETDVPDPLELDDPLADDPLDEDTSEDVSEVSDPETSDEDDTDVPEPLALEDPLSESEEAAGEDDDLDSSAEDNPEETETPAPRSLSANLTAAVVPRSSDAEPFGTQFDDVSDSHVPDDGESEPEAQAEPEPKAESEPESEVPPADSVAPAPTPQTGIASALAAEIRAGEVADEDLDLLREELDFGLPRSVDVRIRRLQSQMDDLEAYSDALETFLDENGTADELVTELRSELDSLSTTTDDLEDDIASLRDEAADLNETTKTVDSRVDEVSSRLDGVDDRVEDVAAGVDSLDDEMGDVRSDLADLDERIVTVEELSADERAELEAELDAIEEELEALDAFRDRLSSVFGGEQ
ncbi:hypothetical protein AUR64_05145 [Haloprofundus marisrubri]|uniref:Uncharacterized protein n=1 Tax=Haloprofundus marisrubri TaxID=1514971 RepID=A0A0W1RD99_9EURY|nr:hypothetical protein [Haloprofundus marisrubri]KTG11099.1 hypothetical protein AUR64_05145 [Haloprofundus marisrubri]